MPSNMFHVPEGRPDPAHWTRTNVGLTSPLWWPFLMAAGAGAAWFTYTNWARIAGTPWTGDLQRRFGETGNGGAGPLGDGTRSTLDESLSVQGADPATDAANELADADDDAASAAIDAAYAANLGPVPEEAAPKPRKKAAKKSQPAAGKTAAKKTATKTAAKTAAKKAPAKTAAAKKAPAKKTAAKKTAGKGKR